MNPRILCVAGAAFVAGCFKGQGDTPPDHLDNEVPQITVTAPAGLSTGDVAIALLTADADGEPVGVWDRCPYPGASPILSIGFSFDGNIFLPIAPGDLVLDSAALAVPTCDAVEAGETNTLAAGAHTLVWKSKTYVPESGRVTFRMTVRDAFTSSEPGTSSEFLVANGPRSDAAPPGARPSQTLAVSLSGQLTSWSGATVTSSSALSLAGLAVTSTTAATVNVTMPASTAQVPNLFALVTPGAGEGGSDQRARGYFWTCPVASDVVEHETTTLGDLDQFICGQGGSPLHVDGNIYLAEYTSSYSGDGDFYVFTATSAMNVSVALDWSSTNGAGTDYDVYLSSVDLTQDVIGAGCADVAKPEVCAGGPLIVGKEYLLEVYGYEGEDADYTLDLTFTP